MILLQVDDLTTQNMDGSTQSNKSNLVLHVRLKLAMPPQHSMQHGLRMLIDTCDNSLATRMKPHVYSSNSLHLSPSTMKTQV